MLYMSLQVACVIHAAYVDGDTDVMFLPAATSSTCSMVSRARLKSAFELGATFVDLVFGFSTRFNAFRLTQEETALFCALMLISPGMSFYLCIVKYCLIRVSVICFICFITGSNASGFLPGTADECSFSVTSFADKQSTNLWIIN